MPGIVTHLHLNEDVTGKKLSLTSPLMAFPHFDDFLSRNQNLPKLVLQAKSQYSLLQRGFHLVFIIRVRVNHVPLQVRHGLTPLPGKKSREPKQEQIQQPEEHSHNQSKH